MKPKQNPIISRWKDKPARTAMLIDLLYWLATVTFFEVILHIAAFGAPGLRFGYVVAFGGAFACILALLVSFLGRKLHLAVTLALTLLLVVLYGSQLVYYFIFGTLYSVALMQQGGAAIESFFKETVEALVKNILWLLPLFLPMVAAVVLHVKRKSRQTISNALWRLALVVLAVVLQLGATTCLKLGGTDFFTDHYFYYSDTTTTDQATDRFGLLTAFRLDLVGTASTPSSEGNDGGDYFVPDTTPPAPTLPQTTEPGDTQPAPTVVEYNVLDFDFQKLNTLTGSKTIQSLNQYCASIPGTNKNAYTGMLEDYNLIVLCAESFSAAAVHPELTPTIYRLCHEGIVFENYYNTYPNNTSDGEYTLCTGLYPDTSRGKEESSFYASRDRYLPFCLATTFKQQKEIQPYGYHNYLGFYYGRDESHTNMGYKMKFAQMGMNFTTIWPASDLEMMEQSIDDYLSADQQFHAYYMTFSAHMSYRHSLNPITRRNWDLVKHLDMSEEAKGYLACNIELDKALAYLMQRLEEAGVADKTAIVMAGDHYPYGLSSKQYAQLLGYTPDKFGKYKSNLIFWVGGLEENIVVDEYCCNADILPTILNLWGMRFDSRMMAGTDVFSDGTHMAILTDMSFLTDKVWMDGSTGEVKYLVDKDTLPDNYVENMVKLVKTKYSMSKDILNSGYYNFLFEKDIVRLDRDKWRGENKPDPEPSQPSALPDPSPPDTSEPAPSTPAPIQPEVSEPEVTQPKPTQTESSEPESSRPQATQPDATQPEAPKPPTTTPAPTLSPAAPEETPGA